MSKQKLATLFVFLVCSFALLLTSAPATAAETASPLPPREPGHVYVAKYEANGIINGFYQVTMKHYLDAQYTLISNGLLPTSVRIDQIIRDGEVEADASQTAEDPKIIVLHNGGPRFHGLDPWRYMEIIDILLGSGHFPTPDNVDSAVDGDWDELK